MTEGIVIALFGLMQAAPHGWLTENVLIALIGLLGAISTALGVVLAAWIKERSEASKDRDTADRVLDAWELLSLSQQRHCFLPDGEKADLNGGTAWKPNTGKPSTE